MTRLDSIFKLSQPALMLYCETYLEMYGYKNIISTADYLLAQGDIPICLVAHLDTVFDDTKRKDMIIFHDQEKNVYWSPNGLGADDRAGVLMILDIISNTGLRPHILFCTDEEMGGLGASEVAKIPGAIDVKYFIELDRAGIDDCVFYDCDNDEFQQYVEAFGFKTQLGSFTDISFICPEWGIAGVNLSVGYVREHSQIEHLFMNYWEQTKQKVIKMLDNPPKDKFIYIEKERSWNRLGFTEKEFSGEKCNCEMCGQPYPIELLAEVDGVKLCPLCEDYLYTNKYAY